MQEMLSLLPKVRWLDPFRRHRYRHAFTRFLKKHHPEGLEYKGLKFILAENNDDYDKKNRYVKVEHSETGKLLYSNGYFCRWSWGIRRKIKHIIYAYGWAYYKECRAEIRSVRAKLA